MKKIYEIRKKYLAEALSFLGFRYYKQGFGDETTYTFENTEKFATALHELSELKNKLRNY